MSAGKKNGEQLSVKKVENGVSGETSVKTMETHV